MKLFAFLCGALALVVSPAANAQSGLAAVLADPITVLFVAVNLALTLYFIFWKFDRFAVAHGPEILTTVGIAGCFTGIAWAMLSFDATNISASVPHLLDGVKTAFVASLSGVLGSLAIRWRHHRQKTPIAMPEGAAKSASLDDVVNALTKLQSSLSGTEDGTLLTQFKLLRQEQSDELGKLRKSFETFAEKMAEDGSKALIDALKEVIADFNAKINEQFGENFKQLNSAVEHLVIWQQQYKEELDRIQAVQQGTAAELQASAKNLSAMVERSSAFTDAAANLERLLVGLAQQHAAIEQSERAMVHVLEQMQDVTPEFTRKFEELINSLREGVTQVQNDVTDVVQNFGIQHQSASSELKQLLIESQLSLREGVRKTQGEITDVVRNFGIQYQSSASELKQLLVETLHKSQTDVNEQLSKSLDTVRQSVITLDKGLQEELTKSLETLGRQLASLSEKFVTDYTPLTERLREVVRLASD